MAASHNAGALVPKSPFTSLPDLATEIYCFFPARWLTHMKYYKKATTQSISNSVLINQSTEDGGDLKHIGKGC